MFRNNQIIKHAPAVPKFDEMVFIVCVHTFISLKNCISYCASERTEKVYVTALWLKNFGPGNPVITAQPTVRCPVLDLDLRENS